MYEAGSEAGVRPPLTLPAWGIRPLTVQAVFLAAAALVLPAAAHLTGLPVRVLLPMHWPVLLAGLCYGWRSGALLGAAAPGVSFLISGMPYPAMLPAMSVELAAYGFLAGFLRQEIRLNPWIAAALAVVGGRIVFVAMAAATGAASPFLSYLEAALLPGLGAALVQILLLPAIASRWVRHDGR